MEIHRSADNAHGAMHPENGVCGARRLARAAHARPLVASLVLIRAPSETCVRWELPRWRDRCCRFSIDLPSYVRSVCASVRDAVTASYATRNAQPVSGQCGVPRRTPQRKGDDRAGTAYRPLISKLTNRRACRILSALGGVVYAVRSGRSKASHRRIKLSTGYAAWLFGHFHGGRGRLQSIVFPTTVCHSVRGVVCKETICICGMNCSLGERFRVRATKIDADCTRPPLWSFYFRAGPNRISVCEFLRVYFGRWRDPAPPARPSTNQSRDARVV
ncbi:hypothetical protein EVAR_94429_1 [Eumeta japonica]|uniref:Uncharacterized protein n=1 Tax=Eumeta variegata TaxID=151549 RepID=A0A4C1TQ26_EUMVA|nr:hypothetical protein EVAR_94429_1 [Eumeta japonica]